MLWFATRDGDARARAIFDRHYSRQHYTDGRSQARFVGPGQRMVLLTSDCSALWIWRKFIDKSGQPGVNCAVFRNEGRNLSSNLIREAEELAWLRWPGERLYTYVAPKKIRSTNPGYCFQIAGWHKCGTTKSRKLVILEKLPQGEHMTAPHDPTDATATAEHIRNSRNWIGAYPDPKQVDGQLVIDVPPFTQGDNAPARATQHPDALAPKAQGPAEPHAAGERA